VLSSVDRRSSSVYRTERLSFYTTIYGRETVCCAILSAAATTCYYWRSISVNPLMPDRPDVKFKNDGLGQYGAEPHYSTFPFWQLCALKG